MESEPPLAPQAARQFRIATRQSKLAQVQARKVGDLLKAAHPGSDYELVFVTTTGDTFLGDLSKVGGKEAFVKEIDAALLAGAADIAVHSMKDVPTDIEGKGLTIAAILPRNDKRDVIICRKGLSFTALGPGARVGTSSVRRAAQLRAAFPYLDVQPVRGNVDSRLAKLDNGDFDALVLAKAGLDLLGLTGRITDVLEPDMMCPAVAQGAIGIVCKAGDEALVKALKVVGDADTYTCVMAERDLLDTLGGSCHTPIAAFVEVTAGRNLRLIGMVVAPDGSQVIRVRDKVPYEEAATLGRKCGEQLLAQGAADIIAAVEKTRVAQG